MSVETAGVQVTAAANHADEVLTPEALGFVAQLHRSFNLRRQRLLGERRERQARFDAGELPDFLPNTQTCAPTPTGGWRQRPPTSMIGGWRSPARPSRR